MWAHVDGFHTHRLPQQSKSTKPFLHGTRGSKILLTTRNENVVNVVPYHIVQVYPLSKLSNEDCWLVFANHAFPPSESSGEDRRALEKIGMEIVKKCNGLPLACFLLNIPPSDRAT